MIFVGGNEWALERCGVMFTWYAIAASFCLCSRLIFCVRFVTSSNSNLAAVISKFAFVRACRFSRLFTILFHSMLLWLTQVGRAGA